MTKFMTGKPLAPLVLSLLAMAVLAPLANASDTNACDTTCGALVDSNGNILGISGQPGWSSTDDQWCEANFGINPDASASTTPGPSATPSVSASAYAVTALTTARCQYHNSQLMSYCQAYVAAGTVSPMENMLMLLDVAATGTCAMACVMHSAQQLCSTASKVTGVAEIASVFFIKNDGTSKMVSTLLGGVGIVEGTAEGHAVGAVAADGSTVGNDANSVGTTIGGAKSGATTTIAAATKDCTGNTNAACTQFQKDEQQQTADQKKERQDACISMAAFAVMTGIRYTSMQAQQKARDSACDQVNSLTSNATALNPTVTATVPPITTQVINPPNNGSTSGGSGTTGTNQTAATQAALGCVQANGLSSCTTGNAGTAATAGGDVAALTPGLGQALAPTAAGLLGNGLLGTAASGGPGAAVSGALAGAVPDNIASQLADIAKSASLNPEEFGVMKPGGGGAGGGGGEASNPLSALGGLLGGNKPGSNVASGSALSFGQADSNDIWHSKSSLSLFDIVSKRVEKVEDRVEQVDWATPLNRAIAGVKNPSNSK